MMRKLLPVVLLAAALPALGATSSSSAPKKMVCWTDENGVRACGDRVPPQYAKGDREVIDNQGRVVQKKEREKTAEERAEAERKAAEASAERLRVERQTRYDQYLLQTFGSVAELEGARDSRLRTLDGQIAINDKSVSDTENSLKNLRDRADTATKNGKEPDARLLKQIKTFEAALVDGLKSRESKKKEHDEIETKFAGDIARYKKLRAHEIQIGSMPDPVPAAAEAAAKP